MLNLKHAYSRTHIIWILIFIIFKIIPKTGNLRQSYKWINFTKFLGRKNRGIIIAVTQKICNLRVIPLNMLVII